MSARIEVMSGRLACLAMVGFISWSASAAEAERFLCRADQAIGFGLKDDTWRTVRPDVADRMYVVSQAEVFDGRYVVTQLGEKAPLYYCESDEAVPPKMLSCGMRKLEFVINVEIGRFQHFRSHGFIDTASPQETGPMIEIGRCSPFE